MTQLARTLWARCQATWAHTRAALGLSKKGRKRGRIPIAPLPPAVPMEDAQGPSEKTEIRSDLAGVIRELNLELRNKELRIILDTVEQGFLTVQLDGLLRPERSGILERWLGPLPKGSHFWDVVERIDPRECTRVKLAWSQVTDGFLPIAVALDQLPSRLNKQGQYFEVAYYSVEADRKKSIVVVLTDVTQALEKQRVEANQRSFAILVERLFHDRRGFLEFWHEATRLVAQIVGPDSQGPELRRALHTLKGNLGFLQLFELAAICHSIEGELIAGETDRLTTEQIESLTAAWEALATRLDPLLHRSEVILDVARSDYEHLVAAVSQNRPHAEVLKLTLALSRQPVAQRLHAARDHLQRVAVQLGKAAPQVTVLDHGLTLPPGSFGAFWNALVHVLNNAADHGIEPDDMRRQLGKPVPAHVVLESKLVGSQFVLEVRDDGPGIAWERLRAKARDLNLPHERQEDLIQAMFADGVSSKDEASNVSGRGEGLSALRATVLALGGQLTVASPSTGGTTWTFRLPFEERSEPPLAKSASAPLPTKPRQPVLVRADSTEPHDAASDSVR